MIGPSRADDLESLAYTVISILRGSLPWQRVEHTTIFLNKQLWSGNDLGFGYPQVFGDFVNYTRALEFESEPDYARWKRNFKNLLTSPDAGVVVGTSRKNEPDPKPLLQVLSEPPEKGLVFMTPFESDYIPAMSAILPRIPTRRDLIGDEKAIVRGQLARIEKLPTMPALCAGPHFMLTEEQEDQDEEEFGRGYLDEIDKFWL